MVNKPSLPIVAVKGPLKLKTVFAVNVCAKLKTILAPVIDTTVQSATPLPETVIPTCMLEFETCNGIDVELLTFDSTTAVVNSISAPPEISAVTVRVAAGSPITVSVLTPPLLPISDSSKP